MRKTLLSGITLALALGATPSLAADNGIYLGGSIGQSGAQDDSVGFDADATGYKLILGWRFLDWLSVEGNYIDFGSGSDNVLGSRVKTDADGLSLSAVGFLPLGPVDLFARAGVIDWSANVKSPSFPNYGEDGTDLTYGLGAQFRLGSLGFRAEYEVFDLGATDLDMFSIGVTWTFF
jgi:hypothetical protein